MHGTSVLGDCARADVALGLSKLGAASLYLVGNAKQSASSEGKLRVTASATIVRRHLILDRIDRLIFERRVFGGPGSGIAIACQSPELLGSLGVWGLVIASGSGVEGGGGGAGLKDRAEIGEDE